MAKRRQKGLQTKYKPEYVQRLLDFFDIDSGEWAELENSRGEVQWVYRANQLPLYQSFARAIGVAPITLRAWANAVDEKGDPLYPDFRAAYEAVKGHQLRVLVENGLNGGYQQAFAIFTAKNILGWRDAYHHTTRNEDAGAVKMINSDMSPQEAAEAYADTIKSSGGDNVIPMRAKA